MGWVLLLVALGAVRVVAAQELPDLVLDTSRLGASTRFDLQSFAPDACELQAADRCVGGSGPRTLLRFDVLAVNRGTADLILGVPPTIEPPNTGSFSFSVCHNHFHFDDFARYELRQRGSDGLAALGQKRSFCIEDAERVSPGASTDANYCCGNQCGNRQGVQVGWGDVYPSHLPCQWIDVTGVAPGDYDLCVLLNTERLLAEAPEGNDGCVPVSISAPSTPAPRVRLRSPRAHARRRVGRRLVVKWRYRGPGELLFQDVWLSRDGGATYDRLAHAAPPYTRTRFLAKITPDMASDRARVRVDVCVRNPPEDTGAGALQCGTGWSGEFRILP